MHHQLEIIMPPTDDIDRVIAEVLAPYDENGSSDDENWMAGCAFWDFYVIGGRFAGEKMQQTLDPASIQKFHDDLHVMGCTVSGLQCGKQQLSPASQIPAVDALWFEHFPGYPGDHCPLFDHANNQYEGSDRLPGDVMVYRDVTDQMNAARVIIAAPQDHGNATARAVFMLADDVWNGTNHMKTAWSGGIRSTVEMAHENRAQRVKVADDWLVITVDCHS